MRTFACCRLTPCLYTPDYLVAVCVVVAPGQLSRWLPGRRSYVRTLTFPTSKFRTLRVAKRATRTKTKDEAHRSRSLWKATRWSSEAASGRTRIRIGLPKSALHGRSFSWLAASQRRTSSISFGVHHTGAEGSRLVYNRGPSPCRHHHLQSHGTELPAFAVDIRLSKTWLHRPAVRPRDVNLALFSET